MLRHLAVAAIGAVVLFVVSELLDSYNDFQLAEIGVFVVAIAGLSLLVGESGQISLGNGAFMAVGAYVGALVMLHTPLPYAVSMIVAAAAGVVSGVVIGLPASRLRGPYLAGMTLALAVGLPALAIKFGSVLGGDEGLSVNPLVPPANVDPERWLCWFVLAFALLVLVLLGNLARSRFGRAFRAVRDDEITASLAGISVGRTQILAFAVSAGCAGLSGALLGVATGIVSPGAFDVTLSVSLLAGVVVGGTGSLLGAWWGAVLLVYVPQWSTSIAGGLHLQTGQSSNVALLLYGAVLIVVVLAAPRGIQGLVRLLVATVTARVRHRGGAAADGTATSGSSS